MSLKAYSLFAIPGLAALLMTAGCEVDSADSRVRISPDSGVLRKHQSVTLSARGGYRYTWSLGTEEWGTLNKRTGGEVVYTSLYEPAGATPVVQVITVVSTFTDAEPVENPVNDGRDETRVSSGEAYITHLPANDELSARMVQE